MKLLVSIGLLMFLGLGCAANQPTAMVKEEVLRVYMQQAGSYFWAIKNGNAINFEHPNMYYENRNDIQIMMDVPVGKPLYVERFKRENMDIHIIIHIHDINDLNPTGWDHGKGGHGTTTIIE